MALAWLAWRNHAPSWSMPTHGAERYRILKRVGRLVATVIELAGEFAVEDDRIANGGPVFVPPKQRTSTPACHVISFGATPSEATALANARRPCACAGPVLHMLQMALSSATE